MDFEASGIWNVASGTKGAGAGGISLSGFGSSLSRRRSRLRRDGGSLVVALQWAVPCTEPRKRKPQQDGEFSGRGVNVTTHCAARVESTETRDLHQ